MPPIFIRSVAALVLAGVGVIPSFGVVVEPKPYTNNNGNANSKQNDPPARPEPLVIRFEAAQRQKLLGNDIMVVTGTEVLTGKERQFGVENETPQNKNGQPKYEPNARILEEINKVKTGDYFRIEPKSPKNTYSKDAIAWIDKAAPFTAAEHEAEPGVYVLFDSYKEKKDGVDVYVITLTKFGKYYDCYAPMVQDGKNQVPDANIVKIADEVKKKEIVEATLQPAGKNYFVTSMDAYQAARPATFTKLADADLQGQKAPAVELKDAGNDATLLIPGKMNGKRWVVDSALLADAKKLKPGSAILIRTREVDGKSYVRQIALAPKDPTATPAKKQPSKPVMKDAPGASAEKK